MVEAPPAFGDSPQTIEAVAALALVEGLPQVPLFQKIRLLDVDNHARRRSWPMSLGAHSFNL
jgi:hypothetical protein